MCGGCQDSAVTSWGEFAECEPEFAARVRGLFDAHKHKTLATLRADGAPRISGIEITFADGELTFASMPNARKGADLRRDPRFALHSATIDPIEGHAADWPGEVKIAGLAILDVPGEGATGADSFRVNVTEVVHTHLNQEATLLVIDWWTPGRGVQRVERE